ncbi:MAG: CoB--CoM heterodisulfide reductase iron-sulfur subunit A family protein, partial [Anaerolineaceae bacterium]|nr:CoB--CoM heterodisulfide reductase iron-sulfur subunit A family protein [Anaerolineaceae bacterium]
GINISSVVDVEEVAQYAATLPDVATSRVYKYMCSDPGQNLIKNDVADMSLNRVVVASCSPRMHEPTFRAAVADAGLNEYLFEMTNIREHCSWVHAKQPIEATIKAKHLIRMAIAKARLLEPLEKTSVPVEPRALVIGGGIAGIQSALSLANNGFDVTLVERTPSIGGHMSQWDKTFPTLDCSACILTPLMVDVARHPKIDLKTCAEVTNVSGYIGNFTVNITQHPRYIDINKCVGCGDCADACRLSGKIPNEFNLEMDKRAVPYIPFPQAVPLKYTIDGKKCLMVTRGKCGDYPLCVEACAAGAIDFTQKTEESELKVGTIIVATGFDVFDPSTKPEYGYGKYTNVITGFEFERLVSSSGPTGGHIEINSQEPKKVVFVQCVGSRDTDEGGNAYCSRVCCMYTAKHAHQILEKIPGAEVTILNTDVRAFGKGYEEFYNRVKDEGATYIHRELKDLIEVTAKNPDDENSTLIVKSGDRPPLEADMVVLASAIVARHDAKESIGQLLKISIGTDHFFLEAHPKLRPVDTITSGIFLAGCCQSPKDIPDTVAQALGAAKRAAIPLAQGKVNLEPLISFVIDENCDGCAYCIDPCPYHALTLIEYMKNGAIKKTVQVTEALCQGCGVCQATCPKQGIEVKGFKLSQLGAMVEAALGSV